MTDRELLELAAKAAGYPLGISKQGFFIAGADPLKVWNPLTDDGDALQLAVKLGIEINQGVTSAGLPCAYAISEVGHKVTRWSYVHGSDPYAATRRAIVRAAAAIGRGK